MEQWQHAVDYSRQKMFTRGVSAEILQGMALLAIAEAMHRLAAAIEQRGFPPTER